MIWLFVALYLVIGFILSAVAYRFGEIDGGFDEISAFMLFWVIILLAQLIVVPIMWLWYKIAGE